MCWDCANTSITTKARRDLAPGVAIYTCTMTTDSLRAALQRGCLLERPRVDGAVRRPQFLACPACAAQPARTRQPVPWQGQGRISCGSCAKPRSALNIACCTLHIAHWHYVHATNQKQHHYLPVRFPLSLAWCTYKSNPPLPQASRSGCSSMLRTSRCSWSHCTTHCAGGRRLVSKGWKGPQWHRENQAAPVIHHHKCHPHQHHLQKHHFQKYHPHKHHPHKHHLQKYHPHKTLLRRLRCYWAVFATSLPERI